MFYFIAGGGSREEEAGFMSMFPPSSYSSFSFQLMVLLSLNHIVLNDSACSRNCFGCQSPARAAKDKITKESHSSLRENSPSFYRNWVIRTLMTKAQSEIVSWTTCAQRRQQRSFRTTSFPGRRLYEDSIHSATGNTWTVFVV